MENETQGEIADAADSVALASSLKVIRRLNRNTTWVAAGLVGSVIFAAVMVALQEPHSKSVEAVTVTTSAESVDSTSTPTPGQAPAIDHFLIGTTASEYHSQKIGDAIPGPGSGPASTPEIKQHDVKANAISWSPSHRPDSEQVARTNIPEIRRSSGVRPGIVGVKRRLVALWRRSLIHSEKSRKWSFYGDSSKGAKKQVSYTVETNR